MPLVAAALGVARRPGAFTPDVTISTVRIGADEGVHRELEGSRRTSSEWAARSRGDRRMVLMIRYETTPVGGRRRP